MKKLNLWCSGILFLICNVLSASENHPTHTISRTDTIRFELTEHNNIVISAIINEEDTVRLMFHTAAYSLSLINEIAKNITSIKWTNTDAVKSWGGESTARYSENNLLKIGNFEWDSISIWENEHSGPTTDGKFGPDLFQGKVVEIDFDKNLLMIHDHLPQKTKAYEQLNIIYENGLMFVEGTSTIGDKNYANRFLIHSGYGGTILYDDKFSQTSKIGEQIRITDEQELKDSYGNILKTKKGLLPLFTLGNVEFATIPVGFFEGSIGRQQMSVIGGNLLKRFNMVLDGNRNHIYIKPNLLYNLPY